MLSQHLTIDILNHAGGDLYARTGEGESRAVLFRITSGDDQDWNTVYVNINNPVVTARIVKPDGTFTITTAELISGPGELQEFRFYIPEAATQVSGIGSYDIRIQEDGEENIVYSAQGRFICDDNMLTDEMIESVAEVNGLIFPDDFYTKDDNIAIIDDNVTSTEKTWSSSKIASEISSPDYTNTATGNPIELTDAADAPLVKCVTEIQGSQDLHGYDKPWVGGAGKNILPMAVAEIKVANTNGTWTGDVYTHNGVTFTLNTDDGGNIIGVKVNGTASNNAYLEIPVTTPNEAQIISGCPSGGSISTYNLGFTTVGYPAYVDKGSGYALNSPIRGVSTKASIYVYSGYNASNLLFYPMIELGSTPTTFAPYSNICPITAYTEGEIEVSDGDVNVTTHTTTFPSAIYRGSEDAVKGTATTEWGMIASYAGETLPGEWISDRDEYAPGTTPTTGAQVAYELATPTTSSVTPTNLPIRTYSGYTKIESSTGDIEVEYIKGSAQSLVNLIEAVTR